MKSSCRAARSVRKRISMAAETRKQISNKGNYITSGPLTAAEIKRIRALFRMTQRELAELLNVSVKTVEHWEISDKPVTGAPAALMRLYFSDPRLIERMQIPKREDGYTLRLYYKFLDEVCTVIDVDERMQRVKIKNYALGLQFRAFGRNESPTFEEYEAFLESRCFPRTRDKMKLHLQELGLPFYDPLMIIEKTKGRMAEDDFSLEIER